MTISQHLGNIPSAGELGSEIYTVCNDVMICFLITFLYGCTMGSPSGVVHTTDVICSFFNRSAGSKALFIFFLPFPFVTVEARCSAMASGRRSCGMDLAMMRAQRLSQFWMAVAPVKRSPMQEMTYNRV